MSDDRRPHPDALPGRRGRARPLAAPAAARGVRRPGVAARAARGRDRGRAARAARRSTTCCSPGPPGLGKTSLAQIVAAELDVPFVQTAGPALERKGDIAAFLTALEPRSVFFVDEIHRLPRALEETFYPAMEDRRLPITVGQGAGARVVTLELPPFTLVGATTRAGPADDAAARPLRHPGAPRALLGGRARRDRAPLGGHPRDRARRGRGAARSPRAAAARRASPTGCSSACATTPRCAMEGVVTAQAARGGARDARGRRARARPPRPRDPARDLREVRRAARSGSRRWRSRSARSRTRSRTSTSPTCCRRA